MFGRRFHSKRSVASSVVPEVDPVFFLSLECVDRVVYTTVQAGNRYVALPSHESNIEEGAKY